MDKKMRQDFQSWRMFDRTDYLFALMGMTLDAALADTAALYRVTDSCAARRSSSSPMSYLRNIETVLCPLIFMATDCGTPARIRLRTPDLRKSWKISSGHPALRQAVFHALRNSVTRRPSLWKM